MAPQSEIRILNDSTELFKTAASEFALLARNAVHRKGSFVVALSGGSTPKALYSLLASQAAPDVPWRDTHVFFSDERFVSPDHPDSNFRMANEAMLSKVPISPQNIFRVPTEEAGADLAAKKYEDSIRDFFVLPSDEVPRFDLILLGLGPDGHTASLFPDSAALNETQRLVVANWVEKFKSYRITFTYSLINHAAYDIFLVSGAEKTRVVREIFEHEGANLPAQRVRPTDGKLLWLIDRPAATALSEEKQ
jgi:6-phosphogluconolactonase